MRWRGTRALASLEAYLQPERDREAPGRNASVDDLVGTGTAASSVNPCACFRPLLGGSHRGIAMGAAVQQPDRKERDADSGVDDHHGADCLCPSQYGEAMSVIEQVPAATIQPVVRELDARLVDTDRGRYDIRLYWDESRGEAMLAALTPDGDYIDRMYIPAGRASDAFSHPVIYLDLH